MSVRTDIDGPVLVVTIDRYAVRNAINPATADALVAAFEGFAADDALSVAVLTGAGGTFCAGADLQALAQGEAPRLAADGPGPLGPTRMLLPKPVIAAVEGHAVAGGIELALWCDLRVAARDAVFGVYCRRWGVPLMDGGTIRLPRIVGQGNAMDLILTGRGVSGDEALRMGLANRIVEPGEALSAAVALAHELAALPQQCMRSDRLSAYRQWSLDLDPALAQEFAAGMAVVQGPELLTGLQRYVEGAGRHGAPA